MAEQLQRDEGYTDVQYIKKEGIGEFEVALASGEANINMHIAPIAIMRLDAGDPIIFLAGRLIGCFEPFGSNQGRSVCDLKGKTVPMPKLRAGASTFATSMAAYVGLSHKDINCKLHSMAESMQLLVDGKIDAFIASVPEPHDLLRSQVVHGHAMVNSTRNQPWSQYFCCMVIGNRNFVHKHPVAAKKALRAILKATDICSYEQKRAARLLIDKSYAKSYDYILQALRETPYGNWREDNPEDTMRFYALCLQEVGRIKSNPQKIIAEGTDWRFLNKIKKELKG